jgi:hypothetical protein
LGVLSADETAGDLLRTYDAGHARAERTLDEELRRCFSRRSRLVATQFTWQATVDRLLAEYTAPRLPALEPAAAG